MNKVILIGRLTKDPEIRSTTTGKKVAGFSIAVNDGKDANGQSMTQYFDCDAWERLAEILENYVKKGTQVCVVGSLKTRTWDAPDGSKRRATNVLVREIEILTSRAEAQAMQQAAAQQPQSAPQVPASQPQAPAAKEAESFDPNKVPDVDIDDINIQMPF